MRSTRREARRAAGRCALAFLLGVGALASPWGCTSDQERLATHRARAGRYQEQGRRAEALLELRSALVLEPKNAAINFEIAKLLEADGRLGHAAYYYSEARRLDPSLLDAYLIEARMLLGVDPERAAQLAAEAVALQPQAATAHVRVSQAALVRGDPEAALVAAQRAVELAPDSAEAQHQLGTVYAMRGARAQAEARDPADLARAAAAFESAAAHSGAAERWRSLLARAAVLSVWPERRGEAPDAYRAAIEAARASPHQPVDPLTATWTAFVYASSLGDLELRRKFVELAVEVDDSRIDAWRELARLEEQAGRPADPVYTRLLEQRPQDARAHAAFADALARSGRPDAAVAHLEGAIAAGVEPPELLGVLVDLLYRENRAEAAARNVERLLAGFPGHRSAALASAQRTLAEQPPEEAARALRELVGAHESAPMQQLLALAEFQVGNLEGATAAIDRALALGPISPAQALDLKARIRHAAGDWPSAIQALELLYQRFGALDPTQQWMLARCLYETQRPAEGLRILERLSTGPEPFLPALIELADRERAVDPAAARQRLETAYASHPGDRVLLGRLVDHDLRAGEPDRALARLDAVLAASPAQPQLLVARAQLLTQLGRLAQAEVDARRALELAPGAPAALTTLADLLAAGSRSEEALRVLREADAGGALDARGRLRLARLLALQGEESAAIAQYEQVLAAGFENPQAKNDLAYLLARRGESLDRARKLAEQTLEALPGDPNVLDTLGYILIRMKLAEPAAEQLRNAVRLAEERGAERPDYHYHLGLALRGMRQNASAARSFERALALDPDFPDAERARQERDAALAGKPPPTDLF